MPRTRTRYVWRYLLNADTCHALVHATDWRALCGRTPTINGSWLGGRSKTSVAALRPCQRCTAKIGAGT